MSVHELLYGVLVLTVRTRNQLSNPVLRLLLAAPPLVRNLHPPKHIPRRTHRRNLLSSGSVSMKSKGTPTLPVTKPFWLNLTSDLVLHLRHPRDPCLRRKRCKNHEKSQSPSQNINVVAVARQRISLNRRQFLSISLLNANLLLFRAETIDDDERDDSGDSQDANGNDDNGDNEAD